MFKKVAIGVAVIVGLFLVFVALKSPDFRFSRQIIIQASPEMIFPHINNSQLANAWMPWKDSDPGVVMNYSGPEEGVGSMSSWDSKGNMGTGQALVVESVPNEVVKTQLTYTKPMNMSQLAEISLKVVPEGTLVEWTVSGKNSFIGRIFCTFMNMEKMVGEEFTKGLNNLKSKVEVQ